MDTNPLEKFIAEREAPPEALQQPPPAMPSVLRRIVSMCLTALTVIAILFGVAAAQVVSSRPPQLENWTRQTFHGLSLDSPVSSFHMEDLRSKLPTEVQEMMLAFDSCFGSDKSESLTVGLTRGIYSPEITADLDGGVQGVVALSAEKLGEKDPKYSPTRVIVSGLEGRRAIYRPANGGQVEMVLAGRKNKLWMVVVAYTNAASAQDAQRVLNSIAINPDE
jgi:hypothetical protein